MKVKLTPVSNHWLLYQQTTGDYEKVGKIIPRPNSTTSFLYQNKQAKLSVKEIGTHVLYQLKANELSLQCLRTVEGTRMSYLWKTVTNEPFLKITIKNDQARIFHNELLIAKQITVSTTHIIEIFDSKIDPIFILTAVFPFI